MAIEELGPTFIKLGQILSTRPDQVGMPLAQELQKLQTSVAATMPRSCATRSNRSSNSRSMRCLQISTRRRWRRRRSARPTVRGCMPVTMSSSKCSTRAFAGGWKSTSISWAVLPSWLRRCRSCNRIGRRLRWPNFGGLCGASVTSHEKHATCSSSSGTLPRHRTCEFRGSIRSCRPARVMTMEWLDGAKLCDPALRQMPNVDLRQSHPARRGNVSGDDFSSRVLSRRSRIPGTWSCCRDGAIGLLDFGMVAQAG